ncbi:CRISPR-associated protein Cas4 [Granulicella arctica]|uniref:CRISPR-associated protein Cas4 n=1 Tax=Granulicella arctica TaxID=940613 RepID=UPI0021E0755A|nr:PD-(D/E)XK nuclease family protein [Granulicella arctica]
MLLLLAALGALVVGVLLLRLSQKRKRALGIPDGDVVYQDHESQQVSPPTLVSERLGLRGKPDCLIRNVDGIIPVELKKSARPPARGGVYPNHLIQVLAYIVLVREHYGEQVPCGLVLYGKEEARKV